jgi:hypothetical protein
MSQKFFVDQDYTSLQEAHFSVLQQHAIAESYIEEQKSKLRRENPDRPN